MAELRHVVAPDGVAAGRGYSAGRSRRVSTVSWSARKICWRRQAVRGPDFGEASRFRHRWLRGQ